MTNTLGKDDADIFFYIGSMNNIYDDDVWPLFNAVKQQGITTLEQYINSL